MNKIELEERTKKFAVDVIRLVASFPKSVPADVVGRQLLRAGTSIGANYREANRAESRADFIHKLGIVEKETAEAEYWLELVSEAGILKESQIEPALREANELLRIFNRANRSAKQSSN